MQFYQEPIGEAFSFAQICSMVEFSRFTLANGLRVIVHEDKTTPLVVVNVLYDVGARDEDPERTGFAHLFEHLMFGGSINIPVYDEPLQVAGGENNAYTTNDLTNYYCRLPAQNIATAFWLESDRMLSLAFGENSLDVQKKVVSEEFKEHYINKPYGDAWHKLRDLAYKVHPYRWMTIGKDLSHIEKAQLKDVRAFFFKHYTPINAILTVAGNITEQEVRVLAEEWFGEIPSGTKYQRQVPFEPRQTEKRFLEVKANVPLDALYKCWHAFSRTDESYHAMDLITDILGSGSSSRLYEKLVKEKNIFSNISCYHTGSIDSGLVVVEGKLVKGITIEEGEKAIEEELENLRDELLMPSELQKVKNRVESLLAFEDVSLMNRASSLATYELLGDANLINTEWEKYNAVSADDIRKISQQIFTEENSSTLYYRSEQ